MLEHWKNEKQEHMKETIERIVAEARERILHAVTDELKMNGGRIEFQNPVAVETADLFEEYGTELDSVSGLYLDGETVWVHHTCPRCGDEVLEDELGLFSFDEMAEICRHIC